MYAAFKGTLIKVNACANDHIYIRNRKGYHKRVPLDIFNKEYVRFTKNIAAHQMDCIMYYKWVPDPDPKKIPKWVETLLEIGYIDFIHGAWRYFDPENGEYLMSRDCVFIRNHLGDVRYMEMNDFNNYFVTFERGV